jgi:hypothetical protein
VRRHKVVIRDANGLGGGRSPDTVRAWTPSAEGRSEGQLPCYASGARMRPS